MSEAVYLAADQGEEKMVEDLRRAWKDARHAYMAGLKAFLERPSVERRWTERLTAFLAREGLSWNVEWQTDVDCFGWNVERHCRPCVLPVDHTTEDDVEVTRRWILYQERMGRLPGHGRYLVFFMQECPGTGNEDMQEMMR